MKKRIALVGCGVISEHYFRGLTRSEVFELCAVCDVNERCYARTMYGAYPFYSDFKKMAAAEKPDYVYIATSPFSHAPIAEYFLSEGINVLIEKPMSTNMENIRALYDLGRKRGAYVECVFHWKYADEVKYLRENLPSFGKIGRIQTVICDDYAADGYIREDRLGLGGAWVDSGINVLSYWQEIFSLENAVLSVEEEQTDRSGQVCYTRRTIGSFASVTVDWRTPSREKSTLIECEAGVLQISHSRQTVSLNGKEIFSSPTDDRLGSHYFNRFFRFAPDPLGEKRCVQLHELLFSKETHG